MARQKRALSGSVDINMTPMIDCTFQLIIFFIITAQMASEDLAKVAVPKPFHSIAISEKEEQVLPNRVIVNIPNRYGEDTKDRDPILSAQPEYYQIGMTKIHLTEIDQLTNILKDRRARAEEQGFKEFYVEVRGDRDVAFSGIEPVLRAAAEAKIAKMSLTAIADPNITKIRR